MYARFAHTFFKITFCRVCGIFANINLFSYKNFLEKKWLNAFILLGLRDFSENLAFLDNLLIYLTVESLYH